MEPNSGRRSAGSRCVALVGPYLSGKTTLLEAILFRTGATPRQGKISDKSTIGDASPEARAHGMSVELNVASTDYLGERYTFLDCPGSIEFNQDLGTALIGCDVAVVVCEADEKKVPALQLILKRLDEISMPRVIFINKIDSSTKKPHDVLEFLQPASSKPLILRQMPIFKNGVVSGFVDLALERGFVYREHAESEVIEIPADMRPEEKLERFAMLEKLADHDDELMEQLLSDLEPPRDRVFADLARELAEGLVTPVLFGSAEHGNGVGRLLKALRHEAPVVEDTVKRLGLKAGSGSTAQILKTFHTAHGGKLSIARVLGGELADGALLYGAEGQEARVAGVFSMLGSTPVKKPKAALGDTVALGRLDKIATGETVSTNKGPAKQLAAKPVTPGVYGVAISVTDRKDEVKLTSSISKLVE
jgi:elongation factor G